MILLDFLFFVFLGFFVLAAVAVVIFTAVVVAGDIDVLSGAEQHTGHQTGQGADGKPQQQLPLLTRIRRSREAQVFFRQFRLQFRSIIGSSLILASAGTGDIFDIQKLFADDLQLLDIFNFKADGEHTSAAGQIPAGQLLDPDVGGGHGLGHIQ